MDLAFCSASNCHDVLPACQTDPAPIAQSTKVTKPQYSLLRTLLSTRFVANSPDQAFSHASPANFSPIPPNLVATQRETVNQSSMISPSTNPTSFTLLYPAQALRQLDENPVFSHKQVADRAVLEIVEAYTGENNARIYMGMGALSVENQQYLNLKNNLLIDFYNAYRDTDATLRVLESLKEKTKVEEYIVHALGLTRPEVISAVRDRLLTSARIVRNFIYQYRRGNLMSIVLFRKVKESETKGSSGDLNFRDEHLMNYVDGDPLHRIILNIDLILARNNKKLKSHMAHVDECMVMRLLHTASRAALNTYNFSHLQSIEKIYHSNVARLLFWDALMGDVTAASMKNPSTLPLLRHFLVKNSGNPADIDMMQMLDYLLSDEMVWADVLLANTDTLAFYLQDIGRKLNYLEIQT